MTRPDSRSLALAALMAVLEKGTDAQAALDQALSRPAPPPSARGATEAAASAQGNSGLCTELVYGTLRNCIRIQWFLQQFLPNPESLPREMTLALTAACHELFFLRVPEYATVDTYVGMIRKKFGPSLAGVTNGVLRNALRSADNFVNFAHYEAAFPDRLTALACYHSCPEWLARLWAAHYGQERAAQYMAASCQPAPVGLRLYPRRLRAAGKQALVEPLLAKAVVCLDLQGEMQAPQHCNASSALHLAFERGLPPEALALVRSGLASRQSGASLQALLALRPETWASPVWDCCAGRGGKTMALLEAGLPVALCSDISASRLKGLSAELQRIFGQKEGEGLEERSLIPQVCRHGADKPLAPEMAAMPKEGFGAVLVDAPCSGFGTLARHPEIRLRRTEEDVRTLAALQGRILRETAKNIRRGGVLVYMTCTTTPAENEEQVAAFVEESPGFTRERVFATPPDTPYREFFFGAVLRKNPA